MKKALVLIAVAAILFSSGCTSLPWGQKAVTSGYALTVNAFEPDMTELETSDKFDLYLEVENVGGTVARNTYAHLFNLDWITSGTSADLGDIEPPDELSGIPGEIKEYTWSNIQVPSDLQPGVVYSYSPRVRLMYNYQTIATANIPIMKKDEYKRLSERNLLNLPAVTTQVSKGPLSVVISARTPIVIDSVDEDSIDFRVNVDLLPNGGVINPNHDTSELVIPTDELDELEMTIYADGIDSPIECDAFETPQEKSLRRGDMIVYTCELKANDFSASRDIPVRVQLDYVYFEDYATSITVRGD